MQFTARLYRLEAVLTVRLSTSETLATFLEKRSLNYSLAFQKRNPLLLCSTQSVFLLGIMDKLESIKHCF